MQRKRRVWRELQRQDGGVGSSLSAAVVRPSTVLTPPMVLAHCFLSMLQNYFFCPLPEVRDSIYLVKEKLSKVACVSSKKWLVSHLSALCLI